MDTTWWISIRPWDRVIQAWPLTILPDSRSNISGIGRNFQYYPSNKTPITVSKSPFHQICLSCYWIWPKKIAWNCGCSNMLCLKIHVSFGHVSQLGSLMVASKLIWNDVSLVLSHPMSFLHHISDRLATSICSTGIHILHHSGCKYKCSAWMTGRCISWMSHMNINNHTNM